MAPLPSLLSRPCMVPARAGQSNVERLIAGRQATCSDTPALRTAAG